MTRRRVAESRAERLRRLGEVFDSPLTSTERRRQRERVGPCWDCVEEHVVNIVILGGGRVHLLIRCGCLDEMRREVLRALPFECAHYRGRERLRVLDGGRGE